jgi:glyoxylase-like metal-dependent hydrolase (beta-lactamase superfamily II)
MLLRTESITNATNTYFMDSWVMHQNEVSNTHYTRLMIETRALYCPSVPYVYVEEYVPVLDSVKAKFWQINPEIGYAVKNVGGGVYVISDNMWQSAWLVTDDGVIVFDAPETFGKNIAQEVSKVTDKPIKMLVYSHTHKDHIGGSAAFKNLNGLKIISLESVSDFLKEMKDPNRLVPNETFESNKTIELGGKTVELSSHYYHSPDGDLFIYIPHVKFLMAIDTLASGYVPFHGFDLTANFGNYIKVFDKILKYEFDTFVGGHLTDIATRKDVEITKEYTMDVYNTVKRIHNNLDQAAVVSESAKKIGWDNKFLLFKILLDKVTADAVNELQPRWINRLAGVDVWLESHVRTALIFVRWDDKL